VVENKNKKEETPLSNVCVRKKDDGGKKKNNKDES